MKRSRRRLSVMPTGFGLLLVAAVIAALVFDITAVDPQVAGLAWCSLAAVVAIGAIWPLWVVAASRVEVHATESDVVAGEPVRLTASVVVVGGLIEVSLGAGDLVEARSWSASGRGVILLEPVSLRRGVIDTLELTVRSSAPLGVVRVERTRLVALAGPVWIAPAPIERPWSAESSQRRALDGSARQPSAAGDLVRSVRPYVLGDPAHLVHWPTSARAGELLVRELEPPGDLLVAVVVHLDGGGWDETVAGRAAGLVEAISDAGGSVVLCTATRDGPRATSVASRLHAGRILAEAVPGDPGAAPPGAHAEHVRADLP